MNALGQKLNDYRDFINKQDGQSSNVFTHMIERYVVKLQIIYPSKPKIDIV